MRGGARFALDEGRGYPETEGESKEIAGSGEGADKAAGEWSPELTTAELLKLVCSHMGISLSRETLCRALREEGIVLMRVHGRKSRALDEMSDEISDLEKAVSREQVEILASPVSLSDEEWAVVLDIFDNMHRRGRSSKYSRRAILEACLYVSSTGCAWRKLPTIFPPWYLVCRTCRRWEEQGRFRRMDERLGKR